MCMDAQMPWSTGCARAACHEDLHRDVLMRRSAWMRARRFVSPSKKCDFCDAQGCANQTERRDAREVGSPLAASAAGYIALRCPASRKPRVSIHGHPLGGAKHASLKDTAEPLYPGSSRHDSFTFSGSHQGAMDNWLQFFSC